MTENDNNPTPSSRKGGSKQWYSTRYNPMIGGKHDNIPSMGEEKSTGRWVLFEEADREVERLRALVVKYKAASWNFDGPEKIRAVALDDAVKAVKASAGGDFVMTGPAGILLRAVAAIRALSPTATESE